MKSIAVDMDGVLADVYSQFMTMHTAQTGHALLPEEINGKPESAAFAYERAHVNTPGFFRNAPLIAGSAEVLARLNQRYRIFIVSAAIEFPNSLAEKLDWLGEHFSFINWRQIVFCGSKEIVKADIMIDDHFKNLNFFDGETYLFTQPHNILADPGKNRRVDSWQEISRLLLMSSS